ncbi:MAG: CotH kinase family protein [Actinobacteria bacterium]|nr:CotH kinase family protein [Actinomycetota bacterium]
MAPNLPRGRLAALVLSAALVVAACGGAGTTAGAAAGTGSGFFDPSQIHEIAVTFDTGDYEEMIDTYAATGEKEWIEATITIDGTAYEHAGVRLKGNSSLFGLRQGSTAPGGPGGPTTDADADAPESLPWLLRLDEYVDGQAHEGISDFVVRSNASESALNEAVAVEVLDLAGLASQDAVYVRFSVNGSDETLRLVLEHPDDVWMADAFSADGALYKAESTGDYTYRGDDPDAYDEVFDQEAGEGNADLTPLIEFLQFLNESDDATFAAEIADRLDVDAFATYLAAQELIANFDDIDGPGNNSYLYWDPGTGEFTVVPWDHNLAYGAQHGPGGEVGGPPDAGDRPDRPAGGPPDAGTAGPDAPGGNVLSERFLAVDEYAELVDLRLAELQASLYASGTASGVLDGWVDLLTTGASDLVDPATVASEAAAIAAVIEGSAG